MQFTVATTALLATMAAAGPILPRAGVEAVQAILSEGAKCEDTAECRTAEQATPHLIEAFMKYELKAAGQIAGVIALMAFESVDFKYKHNVSPGRPGQGTANMQLYENNILYAQSIPELKEKAAKYTKESDDKQKNELLALVTVDKYNFGSGPWYLKTQCEEGVQDALAKGTDEGFGKYMECVGVELDEDRKAYWTRAKKAFNL